jgi:hypothetical protein
MRGFWFIFFCHGLINYTDTKAFVGFSLKLICKKIFRPIRRKCIHLQTGGGVGGWRNAQDLRKTQKLPQKVTISSSSALSSMYRV